LPHTPIPANGGANGLRSLKFSIYGWRSHWGQVTVISSAQVETNESIPTPTVLVVNDRHLVIGQWVGAGAPSDRSRRLKEIVTLLSN
jgi:hypothetical protein